MVDRETVLRKLTELDRYLQEIDRLKSSTLPQLAASLRQLWAVEHGLQVCIQIVIDLGNHVLAEMNENAVEDYTRVVDRLRDRGVLSPDLAGAIRQMPGFRNVLVREYADVNVEKVHRALLEWPDLIRAYATAIRRLVGPA